MSTIRCTRACVLGIIVALALLAPLPGGEGSGLALSGVEGVRSVMAAPAGISGTKTVCPSSGDYATLTAAIAAINSQGLDGPLTLELCASYTSAGETFPLTFPAFTGSSATNTVTVRPAAGATGLTIASSAAQTIDLNAATYVIFDGRPGGVGSSQELTIENTSTSGTAVLFENDASHNLLQYLVLKGVNNNVSSVPNGVITNGVVYFAGTTGATGNDDNTIDHCDLRDGATTPANLVYAAGTSGKENSGNILSNNHFHDFFSSNNTSSGIYLDAYNTGWTITGNSFYQQATRTPVSGFTHYGIYIGDGDGYVISDNIVGGSQPDGGGAAWTYDSSQVTVGFTAIYLNVGATTASSVQGNTIANCAISVTSNYMVVWSGIYVQSGAVNIGTVTGNTIGSGTGTGSVQATTSGNGAVSYGIYASSSSDVTIANNVIGSITVAGTSASVSHSFVGIFTTGAGNVTIADNTVGSLTTADSIQAATASTSFTSQYVRGIDSGSGGAVAITGNTVTNLSNAYAGTGGGGQVAGIRATSGANTISDNTVHDLSSSSQNNNGYEVAAVVGIAQASTAANQMISRNVIHSLTSTAASGSPQVYGLYYSGPTSGANLVERNLVHSLSGLSAAITGLRIFAVPVRVQNNVVRLGVDAAGAAITADMWMIGIYDSGAAGDVYFYFNTVYVGGGPVAAGSYATYAVRGATGHVFRNNLFVNARTNGGGTGAHAAAQFESTGLTSDYNVFLASGVGGVPIQRDTDNYTLNTWQTYSSQDAHSIGPVALEQVNLVNPTGDAASVDLHVQSPTVIEAAGLDIPTVTDDYAGQARAALTPVDIGAYAGDYTALRVPAISYTPLANTFGPDAPTLDNVTITVPSGVNITPGTRPRLYYKRTTDADTFDDNTAATNGWKWVEAEGTGDSPFAFTPDYGLLAGGVPSHGGVTIQYFVVAQSLVATPVVGFSGGAFASQPASVALTAAVFPLRGPTDAYQFFRSFSGVVTLCASGCDYASLTLADGLFAAISTGRLVGDLTAEIRGDLTVETGANGLYPWQEEGGPWRLTIQPAGGVTRTVTGSGSDLIALRGADRVTLDGLNSGGNALLIRNTTGGTAVRFANNGYDYAVDNTMRNCTVEGNSSVLVNVGFASNNTIANNVIRNRSDVTGGAGTLVSGTGGSGNVIRDNTLMNFGAYGIYIYGSNTNWTISGNTMFNEASFYPGGTLTGIEMDSTGTNSITQNTIRDLSAFRGVNGILLHRVHNTLVARNRIVLTGRGCSKAYQWFGIKFAGIAGGAEYWSNVTLTDNQVTLIPSGTPNQTLLSGIVDTSSSADTVNVYHNSVYIGGNTTYRDDFAFVRVGYGITTVKNNIFFNNNANVTRNHFAAGNQSTGSGDFTSDHNLFAGTGTTAANFMQWGGTAVDFAAWQTSSGGDSHSYADTAANIPAASLFTAPASGDLSILTGSGFAAPPLPSNRGVAGLGVTDDYSGTVRNPTWPDIGAFEFDVDRSGLAGLGTLAGGWGFYDTLGIASGAVTAGADVNAVDVTVASGATLDMAAYALNVAGAVTNNGSLRQTQTVDAGATVPFLTFGSAYYGAEITAGGDALGSTTVTVYGNQACAGVVGTPLQRCYEITPTTAAASSIKFYYTQAEMQTGQTFDSLNVWHYNGSTWDAVTRGGDSGSCSSGALNCYVQGAGITAYSPFQLKNGNPLAAPLETLAATATPAGAVIAWQTTSELNALGYHVDRADATAGAWTRLTGELLPSQAPGSPMGYAYRWTDVTAQRGATYRYRVTAVTLAGAETPLAAVDVQMPGAWLWLPVMTR